MVFLPYAAVTPRRRTLLAVCLLALLAPGATPVAAQQAFSFTDPPPFSCQLNEIDLPNTARARALRDPLSRDAFADAFGAFIDDLDDASEVGEQLRARLRGWLDGTCRPVLDGLNRYLSQMTAAVQSGCQGEVPEDVFKGCYGIKQRLDAELSQLYPRMDAAERERQALDAEAADLRPRLDRAIANAEYLLGRDNTEEALRLFISWAVDLDRAPYKVSVQSCQTFSLIATALGNRVANQKLFVDLLVRNVVERSHVGVILMQLKGRPPLREVLNWEAYLSRSTRTFNATGFRREFYDFSLAENQVRHAAGYMLGGYEFSQKPTELYSYLTDRIIPRVKLGPAQEADFRLAVAAAQIGFQLQSGRLRTTDVGGAIMSRLCQ